MIDLHEECTRLDAECEKKQENIKATWPIFPLVNALEEVLNGFGYRGVEARWSDAYGAAVLSVKPRENRGYKELTWLHENLIEAGFKPSGNSDGLDRLYRYEYSVSSGQAKLYVEVQGSEACHMIEDGTVTYPKYKVVCKEGE